MQNFKKWIPHAILAIVMLVLLMPLLVAHFEILNGRTHYQIYPLFFIAIAMIFTVRWRRAGPAEDFPRPFTYRFLLASSLLVIPISLLYFSSWPAMFALVLALGAVAIVLSSYRRVENLFGIWCLLLLFVRPPNQIEGRILRFMEGLSAQTASLVLDFISIPHVIQGDVFTLFGHDFKLSVLCTGYVSLVSTVAIIAVLLVVKNRPLLHSLLLLMVSLGIIWALNTIRVIAVAFFYVRFELDLMVGAGSVLLLVVSVLLSVIMVMGCDVFLRVMLEPMYDKYAVRGVKMSKMGWSAVKAWDWVVNFSVGGFLAKFRIQEVSSPRKTTRIVLGGLVTVYLLGLLSMESLILYYRQGDYAANTMHTKGDLVVLEKEDVAFIRPGWEVIGYNEETRDFKSLWGTYSRIWRLKYNDVMVVMALDYPFNKWHDVKRCYTIQGWKVYDEELIKDTDMSGWGVSQTELMLPTGDYGFILCSHSDHLGGKVEPKPTTHDFSMVTHYLHPKQWSAPFGVSVNKNKNTFYQTQAMVTTSFQLDDETQREIRLMYAEFREQTRKAIQQHTMQQR